MEGRACGHGKDATLLMSRLGGGGGGGGVCVCVCVCVDKVPRLRNYRYLFWCRYIFSN